MHPMFNIRSSLIANAAVSLTRVAALVAAGISPAISTAWAQPKPAVKSIYRNVLVAEGRSQSLCESQPNRIFVKNETGSECISYFVTKGYETKRQAVVFFDGDMAIEKYVDPKLVAEGYASNQRGLQMWADKLKVRYVFVSRVGLNGSSGNHGERRNARETYLMNTAIDILKQRLGLDRIALAGQSGGSTISASLLSLGRTDVACAVLGSGAFEVLDLHYANLKANGVEVSKAQLAKVMYDPASHVSEIPADPRRRVFVIGDTTDTRTPFDQQVRYVNSIRERGHHALLIPIEAAGNLDHSAVAYTIPTAGGCLSGASDEKLLKANDGMTKRVSENEAKSTTQAATGGTALVKASFKGDAKDVK